MLDAILPTAAPCAPASFAAVRLCQRGGVRLSASEALQLSLQLDLTRLFNARSTLTIEQFLGPAPTARDYGLPDTAALSPRSRLDLQCWEQLISRALALYEPRLFQVQVAVAPERHQPRAARVTIMALAAVGQERCQFYFDTALEPRNVRALS